LDAALTASWTHHRSRLATAARLKNRQGSSPEVEQNLLTARRDYAAARLELAITRVADAGLTLSGEQGDRLVTLIHAVSQGRGGVADASLDGDTA